VQQFFDKKGRDPPPRKVEVRLEQVEDRAWLAKVTNALKRHWQKKCRHERRLDGKCGQQIAG
jgi:hypothetical protein